MSGARVLGPSQVTAEVDVSPFDLAPSTERDTGAAALCEITETSSAPALKSKGFAAGL